MSIRKLVEKEGCILSIIFENQCNLTRAMCEGREVVSETPSAQGHQIKIIMNAKCDCEENMTTNWKSNTHIQKKNKNNNGIKRLKISHLL